MGWEAGHWSSLFRVNENEPRYQWSTHCRSVPGVYRLVALSVVDYPNHATASLNRICGKDPSGTLFIGAAGNLRARVGSLVKTHNDNYLSGGHSKLLPLLKARYHPNHLAVCWEEATTSNTSDRENQLISIYCSLFGEAPPLNAQGRNLTPRD